MKKNENINCRINPITRTITISKPFAKAAGKVGTAEYDELMRAMKDHPDYAVELRSIKKKEGKKTYHNLTYNNNMREYIKGIEADEERQGNILATLEETIAKSKFRAGSYAFVKNWFLTTYPNYQTAKVAG